MVTEIDEKNGFLKCELLSGIGNIISIDMYKEKIVALREAVSNACTALRIREKNDRKIWVIYKKNGDLEIIDNGPGITDYSEFMKIGHYRKAEVIDGETGIGLFGIGKNSYFCLAEIGSDLYRHVWFYSTTDDITVPGIIAEMKHNSDSSSVYYGEITHKPISKQREVVLDHPGLRVVIKGVKNKAYIRRAQEYLTERFALKLARGYKIYVKDETAKNSEFIQLHQPPNFDSKQEVLFTLSNGAVVTGNIKEREKIEGINLHLLKDEVGIEWVDIEYLCYGWINCNSFELVSARNSVKRDDERGVFIEFEKKLRQYLEANGIRKKSAPKEEKVRDVEGIKEFANDVLADWIKFNPDDSLPTVPGVRAPKGPLQDNKEEGKQKSKYEKMDGSDVRKPGEGEESIAVEAIPLGDGKGKRKKHGTKGSRPRYIIVPGKGVVLVKTQIGNEQENANMKPDIEYKEHATNNEDPIIRYDEIQNSLICNTYRAGAKIIKKARMRGKQAENSKFSLAAKKMIIEALYRAIPSNKGIPQEDFCRKIDKATDRLIGEKIE